MNRTTRKHWIKRFSFQGRGDRCSGSRNCTEACVFKYGWNFDRMVAGEVIECFTTRTACEKHGRMFAFKHDLVVPRPAA